MNQASTRSCAPAQVPPWCYAGTTDSAAGDARAAVIALGIPLRAEAIALLWIMRTIRENRR